MTNKVYIIMDQKHRDRMTNELVSKFDFSSASEYGELVFVLAPNAHPRDPRTNEDLSNALSNLQPNDYLLPVGSPVLILLMGAYAALAGDHITHLNILEWERDRTDPSTGCYLPTTVPLL